MGEEEASYTIKYIDEDASEEDGTVSICHSIAIIFMYLLYMIDV